MRTQHLLIIVKEISKSSHAFREMARNACFRGFSARDTAKLPSFKFQVLLPSFKFQVLLPSFTFQVSSLAPKFHVQVSSFAPQVSRSSFKFCSPVSRFKFCSQVSSSVPKFSMVSSCLHVSGYFLPPPVVYYVTYAHAYKARAQHASHSVKVGWRIGESLSKGRMANRRLLNLTIKPLLI